MNMTFRRPSPSGAQRERMRPSVPSRLLAPALIAMMASAGGCESGAERIDPIQRMAYAVKPAVVRVNAYATATFLSPGSDGLEDESRRVSTGTGGSGSGFIVHPEGWIVTSAHVVEPTRDEQRIRESLLRNGAVASLQETIDPDVLRAMARSGEIERLIDRVEQRGRLEEVRVVNLVELSNGRRLEFEIQGTSPPVAAGGSDLALLRIDGGNLPTLSLSDEPSLLQEQIWIAGYPSVASVRDAAIGGWLSSETDLEPTITSGSITAIRKSVSSAIVYQTDAPIYPGHSGGPAVDRHGNVIGVPSWGHAEAERIRFLIPSMTVRGFLGDAGVDLEVEGRFNTLYKGALRAAAEGNWDEASELLEQADAIFPGSPDLATFLNVATRAEREGPRWIRLVAGFALVASVVLLAVGITRTLWSRGRARSLPIPAVREEVVVRPSRGDMDHKDGVSFPQNHPNELGSFIVLNGQAAGRRLGLGGSGIRIGRESRYCEIVFSDPKISRLHAEIVSFEGRTLLIDRNSSNGTFVNDERVERRFLRDGDIIYFGGRNAVAVAFRS